MRASSVVTHLKYSDPGAPVFCVGPQTNVVDGFKRLGRVTDDDGVIVPAAEETAEDWVRFRPGAIPA